MSVSAVGSLAFGDLLTENSIKPWWEKVRGYFFALSAVSALTLTTWGFLEDEVKCLPAFSQNASDVFDFTEPQKELIDAYCQGKKHWYGSYAWLIHLGSTATIYLASTWWLFHPDVINAVHTFKKALKIFEELKFPTDLMRSCIVSLKKAGNEEHQLRHACSLLWLYKGDGGIDRVYFQRCVALSVVLCAFLGFPGFGIYMLATENSSYSCNFPESMRNELYGPGKGWDRYVCAYNTQGNLLAFVIAGVISLGGQLVFTVWGIAKMFQQDKGMQTVARDQKSFAKFMMMFWKNAHPVRTEGVCNVILHIFSDNIEELMRKQLPNAFAERDDNYFRACSTLAKGRFVLDMLLEKFKEAAEKDLNDAQNVENLKSLETTIIEILRVTTYKLDYSKEMVRLAKAKKRWRLLVAILDLADPLLQLPLHQDNRSRHIIEWVASLDLNLNELGLHDERGCSILYFALRDDPDVVGRRFCAAQYIIRGMNGQQNLYVHFGGKSFLARSFAEYEHRYNRFGLKTLKEMIELDQRGNEERKSQEVIKKLCRRYLNDGREAKEATLSELLRYKFSLWDDEIKELARLAAHKEQWKLLVGFMEAYIVPCDVFEILLGSYKIKDFSEHFESIFQCSIQTREIFSITAARNILACFPPEVRDKAKELLKEKGNQLTDGERRELLKFVEDLTHAGDEMSLKRLGFVKYPVI